MSETNSNINLRDYIIPVPVTDRPIGDSQPGNADSQNQNQISRVNLTSELQRSYLKAIEDPQYQIEIKDLIKQIEESQSYIESYRKTQSADNEEHKILLDQLIREHNNAIEKFQELEKQIINKVLDKQAAGNTNPYVDVQNQLTAIQLDPQISYIKELESKNLQLRKELSLKTSELSTSEFNFRTNLQRLEKVQLECGELRKECDKQWDKICEIFDPLSKICIELNLLPRDYVSLESIIQTVAQIITDNTKSSEQLIELKDKISAVDKTLTAQIKENRRLETELLATKNQLATRPKVNTESVNKTQIYKESPINNVNSSTMNVALNDLQANTILSFIPFFKGNDKDTNIKKWFREAEAAGRLLSDSDRLRYFPMKLRGTAQKYFDGNSPFENYKDWKTKMIKRFHVVESEPDLINKFNNVNMREKEKIIDYVERIDSKFTKAYQEAAEVNYDGEAWEKFCDKTKRDRFVDGLRSELKKVVLKEIKKDTTYKKAQELAENAEEAYKYKMALNKINQGGKAATVANVLLELQKLQTENDSDESDEEAEVNVFKKGNYQQNSNKYNKHNNGNNSNQNNNSNKQNNSNENNGNNENSNSQKSNNTKPHRNLECHRCGKKGHIARNCYTNLKKDEIGKK